jgi:hypothetical protein
LDSFAVTCMTGKRARHRLSKSESRGNHFASQDNCRSTPLASTRVRLLSETGADIARERELRLSVSHGFAAAALGSPAVR